MLMLPISAQTTTTYFHHFIFNRWLFENKEERMMAIATKIKRFRSMPGLNSPGEYPDPQDRTEDGAGKPLMEQFQYGDWGKNCAKAPIAKTTEKNILVCAF